MAAEAQGKSLNTLAKEALQRSVRRTRCDPRRAGRQSPEKTDSNASWRKFIHFEGEDLYELLEDFKIRTLVPAAVK